MRKYKPRNVNPTRNKMVQKVVVNVDTTKRTRKRKVQNSKALLSTQQNQLIKMAMFLRPAQAAAPVVNVLNKEKEDQKDYSATLSQILTKTANNEMAIRNLERNTRMQPDARDEILQQLRQENIDLQGSVQNQADVINRQTAEVDRLNDLLFRTSLKEDRMADALEDDMRIQKRREEGNFMFPPEESSALLGNTPPPPQRPAPKRSGGYNTRGSLAKTVGHKKSAIVKEADQLLEELGGRRKK